MQNRHRKLWCEILQTTVLNSSANKHFSSAPLTRRSVLFCETWKKRHWSEDELPTLEYNFQGNYVNDGRVTHLRIQRGGGGNIEIGLIRVVHYFICCYASFNVTNRSFSFSVV